MGKQEMTRIVFGIVSSLETRLDRRWADSWTFSYAQAVDEVLSYGRLYGLWILAHELAKDEL